MKSTRFKSAVGCCLLLAGCVLPRNFTSLEQTVRPSIATALLPVTPGSVQLMSSHRAGGSTYAGRQDFAANCNGVLNTLAAGTLYGPTWCVKNLENTVSADLLEILIDDPDPLETLWKSEVFSSIARGLEVEQLVVLYPQLNVCPIGTVDTSGEWKGEVVIHAHLIRLNPVRIVNEADGRASHWFSAGVIGVGGPGAAIIIPYAIGETLSRSVDKAARDALGKLFQNQTPEARSP